MTIKSTEELSDRLDRDLIRRKRELSSALQIVEQARPHQVGAITKASFCILYAHWEGFFRNIIRAYLEFVNAQELSYSELHPPLISICIKEKMRSIKDSRRILHYSDIVNWFTVMASDKPFLSADHAIERPQIIKYNQIEDVLALLQADPKRYITKKNIIDEKLVRTRNSISHGEYGTISRADYKDTHEQVVRIMDWLKTDVKDAAEAGLYRRTPPAR